MRPISRPEAPVALTVRPFQPSDMPAAAALLAARHRRDRARLPVLAAGLERPAACESIVAAIAARPFSDGVVALQDGRVAGFLWGQRMLLGPRDFASTFVPPHSVSIAVEGHAVAAGQPTTPVYHSMYAVLAGQWVRQGFFWHRTHVVAGDADVQEAWLALGFGRAMTAATRPTVPVPAAGTPALEVHRAGAEDIATVMKLADTLALHHATSPMFWPVLPATADAQREFQAQVLEKQETPYFVAYRDGQALGMQTFLKPGFSPPIVEPLPDVYLFEGVVEAGVRGGGVGTALLAHSLAWARGAGFETCTLHFASGNTSGAPFWLGHGFMPVEHTMERRVDERIAWASG